MGGVLLLVVGRLGALVTGSAWLGLVGAVLLVAALSAWRAMLLGFALGVGGRGRPFRMSLQSIPFDVLNVLLVAGGTVDVPRRLLLSFPGVLLHLATPGRLPGRLPAGRRVGLLEAHRVGLEKGELAPCAVFVVSFEPDRVSDPSVGLFKYENLLFVPVEVDRSAFPTTRVVGHDRFPFLTSGSRLRL